jgi:hypothetical protein
MTCDEAADQIFAVLSELDDGDDLAVTLAAVVVGAMHNADDPKAWLAAFRKLVDKTAEAAAESEH